MRKLNPLDPMKDDKTFTVGLTSEPNGDVLVYTNVLGRAGNQIGFALTPKAARYLANQLTDQLAKLG